jgi:uncharacterized membrane protein YphA (DoxX/SURF4 family)
MEWLYSRYPGGAVGVGLLLLRVVVASWIVHDGLLLGVLGTDADVSLVTTIVGVVLVTGALLLTLGLQTSLAACAGAACLVAAAFHDHLMVTPNGQLDGWFHTASFAFVTALLVVLGPGGYSFDARLSGWRSIHVSARHKWQGR